MTRTLTAWTLFLLATAHARAQSSLPPILREVRFDQKLNEQVPLDLSFNDEDGHPVKLQDYCKDKPVILVLAYFRCPMLCTQVLNALDRSLETMPLEIGKDFNVVTVSIDPTDTPRLAEVKQALYTGMYNRPGAQHGWHFLTGQDPQIKQLADAVGFRYAYDPDSHQYAHASGIMVLTPDGKISRYCYGIEYKPKDLRLGLVEASQDKIGNLADQVLLFCFHYDPMTGKYGLIIANVTRVLASASVLALGGMIFFFLRKERQANHHGRPV